MTDTLIEGARVTPEDYGTGLPVGEQFGDRINAADLGGLALQRGRGQYVDSGMGLTYDDAAVEVTVEAGLAFLRFDGGVEVQQGQDETTTYSGVWNESIVFAVVVPQQTVSLDASATNELWLWIKRDHDGGDGAHYRHGSGVSAPTEPALKLATIDTAAGTVQAHNIVPDTGLFAPTTQTDAYTAAAGQRVFADASGGSFTVTLPAPASNRRVEVINADKSGTNSVSIGPNGSETIYGGATTLAPNESVTVVSDGTDWFIH